MSKRCPDCGALNEDSRIYCSSCGELLDSELRLLKNLSDSASGARKSAPKEPPPRQEAVPPRKLPDEDEPVGKLSAQKKKPSPLPWIILGLLAAAAVIAVIVLS